MLRLCSVLLFIVTNIHAESIVYLATGTAYPLCTGYCFQNIVISSSNIVSTQCSSDDHSYPEQQHQYTFEASQFAQVIDLVGEMEAWRKTSASIDCSNCNKEGYEWLGIATDVERKHTVKFRYNRTIPGFENLVETMRSIRQQYLSS